MGRPLEELSKEEKGELWGRKDLYRGLVMVTCIMDAQGRVMTMGGASEAMGSELLNIPAAKPLVEICEAFGRGKPLPNDIQLIERQLDD